MGWNHDLHQESADSRPVRRVFLGVAVAALVLSCAPRARAINVFDDFSDGNDTANPVWTHLDNVAGSTGQTQTVVSGEYLLQAPGNSTYGTAAGYGFAGGHVGPSYTDVRVTADIKAFPNAGVDGSYFGIAARLNGDNSLPSVIAPPAEPNGTSIALRGYGLRYEPSTGDGELVMVILHGGGDRDVRAKGVTLDNTKDYRFSLTVVGDVLHGRVFELNAAGAVVTQVVDLFRDLAADPPGPGNYDGYSSTPDEPFVPLTSGYSGLFVIGHAFFTPGDATFDNFRAESPSDFDKDGDTDGADFTMWKGGFGVSAAGDADDDGDTDGFDFLVWQRGFTGPAAVTSTPEPATAGLTGAATLMLVGFLRRRRSGSFPAPS